MFGIGFHTHFLKSNYLLLWHFKMCQIIMISALGQIVGTERQNIYYTLYGSIGHNKLHTNDFPVLRIKINRHKY